MPIPDQKTLANEMSDFVRCVPESLNLEHLKDYEFLYFFEAERLLLMRDALVAAGFESDATFNVLDFGFLLGLVPEFLHRFFPRARFTVCDYPSSPTFQNAEYIQLIRKRDYLSLEPCDISEVAQLNRQFDLIVLGEIIEHLDPTKVAQSLAGLRQLIRPTGTLLVTTPNAISLKNVVYGLAGRDAEHPPIPDETMVYGHIHLWSHELLKRTAEYCGWRSDRVIYFHGFERWERAKVTRQWGGWKWQLATRFLFQIAEIVPRWRGYMISTWKPFIPDREQLTSIRD